MTSELLTDATIAERERAHHAARWQREWQSRPRTQTPSGRQAAVAGGETARHCPPSETPAVAGR